MRPDSVQPFGLLQEALEIYRQQFGTLFPVALIVGLIQAMLLLGVGSDDQTTLSTANLVATGLAVLPMLVFMAFSVELLRDVRGGDSVRSAGELLLSVLAIFVPLLVISVLALFAVMLGIALLIVPGLFLATIWAVVVPVYVLERPGIGRSFDRSRELVRGQGWPVFATTMLVVLVSLVGAVFAAIVSIDPTSTVGSFVQVVVTSLITPATTLMIGLLYYRLVELHQPLAPTPPASPSA